MRAAAVLLSPSLAVAPVTAVDIRRGMVITLSDAEAEKCEAEGGCHVISRDSAIEAIEKAAKAMAGNCMGAASFRYEAR
jgi:hypothetical protein